LDSGVYITYHPLSLPLNSATFPITTCLLYRLLSNTIQQKPDQHISPLIVEITPIKGEKKREKEEEEEGEGEREEGGEEEGVEGEEREKREEGKEQFKLKEG